LVINQQIRFQVQIDSSNPYASEDFAPQPAAVAQLMAMHAGWIPHVKVIGILLIVQAFLELLMGAAMIVGSLWIGTLMKMQPPQGAPPPPEEMIQFVQGIYLLLGALAIVIASTRFLAAYGCFAFRGRTLIIVSLFAGLATAFTGLCGLTSVGLCIYGLVVMLNPGVARAFEMVSEGHSVHEVNGLFAQH